MIFDIHIRSNTEAVDGHQDANDLEKAVCNIHCTKITEETLIYFSQTRGPNKNLGSFKTTKC